MVKQIQPLPPFKPIEEFPASGIGYIPTIFNKGMDLYQAVCYLEWYVVQTYNSMNEVIADWNTLQDWIDTELEGYAKEQLQAWLDDGTLASIINEEIFGDLNNRVNNNTTLIKADRIYSEADFETYKDSACWELMNDITITKPILQFAGDKSFDLNGYQITLADTYTENFIFQIGVGVDFNEESKHLKQVFNGKIDCKDKDCSVFHIALAWRLWIHHLKIENCVRGLTSYTDTPNGTYGAECNFNCISIYHSRNSNDNYAGLLVRMTDSVFDAVNPVFFKIGIDVRAGANVIQNCHPWGYPKTSGNVYPIGTYMKICIVTFSAQNKIIGCIADTFEPNDTAQPASYSNGGIGFFICGNDHDVMNCYCLTHAQTVYNNHIGYYFADTNPETNLPNYLARCSLISSHVNINVRTPAFYKQPCLTEKPIQMLGNGFNSVGANQTLYAMNELLSGSTYFSNEYDFTSDYGDYVYLPKALCHKFMVNQNVLHGLLKDKNGTLKQCFIQPYRDIYCTTLAQVQTLANNIIADQTTHGGFLTSYTYTAMYYHDGTMDLLVWNSANRKFYYARTGVEVTY